MRMQRATSRFSVLMNRAVIVLCVSGASILSYVFVTDPFVQGLVSLPYSQMPATHSGERS